MSEARYAVGIDLGTTHCALAYVDLSLSDHDDVTQAVMPVPQLTGPGSVEEHSLLPSFLYLPHEDEMAVGDLALCGAVLSARFVGHRSGHSLNNKVLRALFADTSAWRLTDGEMAVDGAATRLPAAAAPAFA